MRERMRKRVRMEKNASIFESEREKFRVKLNIFYFLKLTYQCKEIGRAHV